MKRVVAMIQYSGPLDDESIDSALKAARFMALEEPRLKVSDFLPIWQILPHMRMVALEEDGTTSVLSLPCVGERFSEKGFSRNESINCGTWLIRKSA